jgi:hypothetical protein
MIELNVEDRIIIFVSCNAAAKKKGKKIYFWRKAICCHEKKSLQIRI